MQEATYKSSKAFDWLAKFKKWRALLSKQQEVASDTLVAAKKSFKKSTEKTFELNALGEHGELITEIAWLAWFNQTWTPGLPANIGTLGQFIALLNSGKLIAALLFLQTLCLLGKAILDSIILGLEAYYAPSPVLSEEDKKKKGLEKLALYCKLYGHYVNRALKIAGNFLMAAALITVSVGILVVSAHLSAKLILIGYALEGAVDCGLSILCAGINIYNYFQETDPAKKVEHLLKAEFSAINLGFAVVTCGLTVLSCLPIPIISNIAQALLVVTVITKLFILPRIFAAWKKHEEQKFIAKQEKSVEHNYEQEQTEKLMPKPAPSLLCKATMMFQQLATTAQKALGHDKQDEAHYDKTLSYQPVKTTMTMPLTQKPTIQAEDYERAMPKNTATATTARYLQLKFHP